MKKNSFLLCFVFLASLRVQAANVTFAGAVVNGSVGDKPTANASVQLLRVTPQGASQDLAIVKTDARGVFKSAPLSVAPNELIFARIDWGGYPYITPAFDGAGRTGAPIDSAKLRLHIYDTSETAPPGMTFVAHHIALKDDGDNLKCTERIVVENPSNKTFIGLGKDGITLGLSLPKGAKNVAIDESVADAKLIVLGKKGKPIYAVSKPITPTIAGGPIGNAIIVNYTLPWNKSVDLSRQLLYPEKFFFIVREVADRDKIVVEAPLLGKEAVQQIPIDGQMQSRVVMLIGTPQSVAPVLAAGQKMEILVSRPVSRMMWAFVGLTAGICIFVPTLMFLGRRKKRAPIEYSKDTKSAEPHREASVYSVIPAPMDGNRDVSHEDSVAVLVDKLATLDDSFAAGEIEEAAYQTQRAQWKQQVAQQLKTG